MFNKIIKYLPYAVIIFYESNVNLIKFIPPADLKFI